MSLQYWTISTTCYNGNLSCKIFMQCFTHPTLSTVIFPTVSKHMRRVVTKMEAPDRHVHMYMYDGGCNSL